MKRRILHVIDAVDEGGAEVVLYHVIRKLKHRFDFGVAVLGAFGKLSSAYNSLEIPIYNYSSRRWNPLTLLKLIKTIRYENYDLLHCWLYKSSILGPLAAMWMNRRSIIHDQSDVYPQPLIKMYFPNPLVRFIYLSIYRYVVKVPDRIIVLTPDTCQAYKKYYSVCSERIIILPNMIDPCQFTLQKDYGILKKELGIPADTQLVSMIARLHPQKDWYTFLQVAEHVQKEFGRKCLFLIIGLGPEESKLRDYVESHRIHNVMFLGYRKDIPHVLHNSDIFLFTSTHEPFGIVILEAMACGCPVVSTRSSGPVSIVENGVDGLLSDVGDIQGLTSHTVRLLKDKEFARKLTQNARQKITGKYNLELFSARIERIYEEILG
jgi:glycosyltransferase involved in cell wall biosynthesis